MIDDEAEHIFSKNRLQNKALDFMISTGSSPKSLGDSKMHDKDDMMCEDHSTKFAGKKHPDFGHKQKGYGDVLPDGNRGAAHPQHHTRGKMPSHMSPDHGPHK